MKAVLEFDLDNPDDRLSHFEAIHAAECFNILRDLDDGLRTQLKHGDDFPDVIATLTLIREKLAQLCEENGVDIWRD
jgi:hypothetical protein